jgi:DNA-binding FadR family transcriptional regulator
VTSAADRPLTAVGSVGSTVPKKLGEVIARQLEREIIDSGTRPGTLLGSEIDLIERLGCSRAVFREAIRLVERDGLVEMRRGVGGGLYVRRPDPEPVARAMALYLDFNGVEPNQLEQARRAIETVCVEQLANTITSQGIERLRSFLAEEESMVANGNMDSLHDFHILVAELTDNPALHLFVDSLTHLTMRQRTSEVRNRVYLDEVHRAHRKIAESIIGRDPAVARHRMVTHLEAVSTAWLPRDASPLHAVEPGPVAR